MVSTTYILSQICVIPAMICLALTFFSKSKKTIIILCCINSFFYAMEYLLLNSYSGAIINTISIIRCLLYYVDKEKGHEQNIISLVLCLAATITLGIVFLKIWVDVFAIIGGSIYTFSTWQKNVKVYKCCCIVASFIWIAYNILYMSTLGVLSELVMLTLNIVGVVFEFMKIKNKTNHKIENEKQVKSL